MVGLIKLQGYVWTDMLLIVLKDEVVWLLTWGQALSNKLIITDKKALCILIECILRLVGF